MKKLMKRKVLFLFCLLSVHIMSQQIQPKKNGNIHSLLEKESNIFMETKGAVGVSAGLIYQGQFYTCNAGSVQKGIVNKPTEDTFYPIASVTKTFTGLLLAMAVNENKVKLDDDIRKYLDGEYPNLQFEGHPILLSHLISHVSRLPFFLSDKAEKPGYSRVDFFKDLHMVKLDMLPGIKFRYSNAAAQLLGFILEKVYHSSYENILQIKITGPLKMQHTRIALTETDKRHTVKGYNEDGSYNPELYNYMQAAGGLKSTTRDLLNYISRQMDLKDTAILLSHKECWGFDMEKGVRYSNSLGWQITKNTEGFSRISQDGNLANCSSEIIFCPELKVGVVILSNSYMPDAVSFMANEILKQIEPAMFSQIKL